ncbi:hypothetical protein [Stenotrophobium rhamnosiphilum]|uniref:Uncharacterized protein n=1 Tax=Stenotrophobium rhamnosiphilum TaxID=2029166 RepID=A0A2T5MB80_9GAMM|nr:hypothetical protein [Stenotrophobium rhamnosiphilum]PTU28242.1 hypothetical protein CJD38_18000 [Stenotrophobium rhamnosiphilum]
MSMTNRKNYMKDSLNIAIKTTFLSFLALCSSCATNQEVAAEHYESCIKTENIGYLPKGYCADSARKLENSLNETDAKHARIATEAAALRKKEQEDFERSDTNKILNAIGSAAVVAAGAYDDAKNSNSSNASSNAFQRPDPRGCIKITALVHDKMCGSPNDIRYEYINTCSYPVNYYFCSQGLDGKWRCDVSGSGNTRPNGKGMLSGCNLTERYAAGSCKGPCNLCGTHDLHSAYAERCGEDYLNKPE